MLFYIKHSKKNTPTKLMGEKPLISDGKRHPWSVMGNAYKLSENFDAGVKKSAPPPPHWLGVSQKPF
jgi:hypothetical protein